MAKSAKLVKPAASDPAPPLQADKKYRVTVNRVVNLMGPGSMLMKPPRMLRRQDGSVIPDRTYVISGDQVKSLGDAIATVRQVT